jgi:hypothetical protein
LRDVDERSSHAPSAVERKYAAAVQASVTTRWAGPATEMIGREADYAVVIALVTAAIAW